MSRGQPAARSVVRLNEVTVSPITQTWDAATSTPAALRAIAAASTPSATLVDGGLAPWGDEYDEADVTSLVQDWFDGTRVDLGLLLHDGSTQMERYGALDGPTAELLLTFLGPVYHGEEWTGDPSDENSDRVSEEWAQLGTYVSRREAGDMIATRANTPCDFDAGQSCAEVRRRTIDSQLDGATVDDTDTFSVLKGVSETDPNIPIVADILQPADIANGNSPSATGSLTAVLQSWQTPPPAHGSTYELYEADGDEDYNDDPYDSGSGEFPSSTSTGTATVRVWVDAATRLPVRQDVVSNSTTVSSYWTYDDAVIDPTTLPSDFFLVAAPENPDFEESTSYRGAAPPRSLAASRASSATPTIDLGDAPQIGGTAYCLVTTAQFGLAERDPQVPRSASTIAQVDALYAPTPRGAPCLPGHGAATDATLTVTSTKADGALAYAMRDAVLPVAKPLPVRTTKPFPLRTNALALQPSPVYAEAADGSGALVLAGLDGTTVLIHGTLTAADAASAVATLRSR
jgi:hypothetical protein